MRSLVEIRELEPRLRLGWSVPRVRRDYAALVTAVDPTRALHRAAACPAAPPATWAGRCDAVMAHWRLVTPSSSGGRRAGGELYVWTVDDAARIRRLEALGRHGVITNDPRLFA